MIEVELFLFLFGYFFLLFCTYSKLTIVLNSDLPHSSPNRSSETYLMLQGRKTTPPKKVFFTNLYQQCNITIGI